MMIVSEWIGFGADFVITGFSERQHGNRGQEGNKRQDGDISGDISKAETKLFPGKMRLILLHEK